jgi:NADH:ubiquinone oxidoreductase subunit 5 (subunit L)/multisubunit Na+/H+ antiporter MnhA subunit
LLIFSGPYESLWTVHNSSAARIAFYVIGLLTVFFTAMYLFRGITSLFQRVPSAVVQPRFFSPFHLVGIVAGSVGLIVILLALWLWFVPFLAPAIGTPYSLDGGIWPANHVPMLVMALVAALAGWGLASLLHARPMLAFVPRSNFAQTMYVLFLNKFYFDEVYSVYIVQPTIRFVRWMWRVVDIRGIDRAVVESGNQSVRLARWLWQMIDVRVIDRAVEQTGGQSVGLARWLWETVDVRRIEKSSNQIGRAADASGEKLKDYEPRTIQRYLVVLIAWLIVAILFSYWLVL